MPEKGRVFTGARCRFTLQGIVIGYAVNITVREELQQEPIETIDNIKVQEHAEIAYRCSMTASQVKIVGETVRSLGFWPKHGSSNVEFLRNVLTQPDMVATLEDRKEGVIVCNVLGVKLATRDFSVNARGVVNEDLSFVCIEVTDESENV